MDVSDLEVEDYHDLVNALLDGPSVDGVVSFRIDWTASKDKHQFHFAPETWDANVVFNTATVQWEGTTDTAHFVSDPQETSFSLFAEVGHERNGVFF
ncbi:MAG TPA: hypothetical protein VE135_16750 [Pyrinomonadaceae bacterium]|nr:hypothetical protein [Pyrinomonadaceae bacterium]